MTKFLRVALAVMLVLSFCLTADASSNKYSDDYTEESSTGHWRFTSIETRTFVPTMEIVANTPATITTASSGTIYVVHVSSDAATSSTQCVSFTLPVAARGLTYKFMSGDGSGMVIRTADSNFTAYYSDMFLYGDTDIPIPATNTQLRVGQENTGATITLHGGSGFWYVDALDATPNSETTVHVETRAVDPKAPSGV